jgi:hypothetical protein
VGRHKSRDTGNFLSLCDEIDPINFSMFYYVPNAKKLLSELELCTEGKLFCTYLKFFVKKVIIDKNRLTHYIDENVYKTIYIHYIETLKLNDLLRKKFHKRKVDLPNGEYDFRHEKICELIAEICKDKGNDLAGEYMRYLTTQIEQREKLVNSSIENNRDLVNMI